ncbi:type I-A CRISPR-associated protein Cas8a2/Csx9 [Candidatus Methanodesulfokora washburnensis]|uniref:Type I-A CRISPR-associated protein Cas8a2/Csx9 n=2 Tax=Candidatus Methanodesulfokora washburnensis TaxID=2478471 RepID=A0A3R9PFU3_9CREN|nr:type I-A CRISPR-associated protein Cas8a2/Csx9 [Candidatus Methanodesulfokores washburnensis]
MIIIKIRPPVQGIMRELIFLGVAAFLDFASSVDIYPYEHASLIFEGEDEDLSRDFSEFLSNYYGDLSSKVKSSPGSALLKNDRESYRKTYLELFGTDLPQDVTYPVLFLDIIRKTSSLLKDGKISPIRSLETVRDNRLGDAGSFFILPSIIKQMEFYEESTHFLKPTTGGKSMVELDPIWFSLLAVGFLLSYAGYHGGAYYLITYPSYEENLGSRSILETIRSVADVNIQARIQLENEEIYELRLSMGLAKRIATKKVVERYEWPLRIYKVAPVGKAFTAEKTLDLDLDRLVSFCSKYLEEYQKLEEKPFVNIGRKDEKEETDPLEAMIILAEEELTRPVSGDNEMIVVILIKDLYRAINSSGNVRISLIKEALYRTLRKAKAIEKTEERVSWLLRRTMHEFSNENNIKCLLKAAEIG